MSTRKLSPLQLVLFVLLIAVCPSCSPATPSPTATSIPPTSTETRVPATETATAVPTSTDTPTLEPTETTMPSSTATWTPTLTPTLEPTETPAPQSAGSSGWIVSYLISENTGGYAGCGDTLIPLSTGMVRSGDVVADTTAALNNLFSIGVQFSGGFYNAVYQSSLKVSKIDFSASDGLMIVYLSGKFTKPKDGCEKERYRDQVWGTIYQFSEVSKANIWVNDKLLGDFLYNP